MKLDLLTTEEAKSCMFLQRAYEETVDEIGRRRFIGGVTEFLGLYDRLFAIEKQLARLQAIAVAREPVQKHKDKQASRKMKASAKLMPTARQDADPENEYAPITPHLPVDVIEVEAIPQYADHSLEETLQRQSDGLIRWNYFTIGSPLRMSRRYEGYRR